MKQDKIKMDFPTTDEEMRVFLESSQPVKLPEKYETPDWLFEELEQELILSVSIKVSMFNSKTKN